ncbi:hypothetical protein ZOSMA_175G00300 [Zostera marina]|uniref:Uncharacterized protein n=1 Tax=Zostera marina TaxID=29655 RepID=A0A0K9PRU8_ZOSMR|nr:hypothetical protein ZOSMA_175G00300 [Zostera marina]
MGESSDASYIQMVQHLIENCLICNMSREESVEAISKHADIKPVITNIVWKELEKENKEFFEAYGKEREKKIVEMKAVETIQKMLSQMTTKDDND